MVDEIIPGVPPKDTKSQPLLSSINLFGEPDPRHQAIKVEETRLAGTGGIIGETLVPDAFEYGGNVAISFLKTRIAELYSPDDPNFIPSDHPELLEGLGAEYIPVMERADSIEEGYMIRDSILEEHEMFRKMEDHGWRGTVALGLAGIIDADLPMMLASGGTYSGTKIAGTLAKLGMKQGRTASAIAMGTAGAEAGLIVGSLDAVTSPDGDFAAIPIAGLGGMIFGSGIGALTKIDLRGNKLVQETQQAYLNNVDDVLEVTEPPVKTYTARSAVDMTMNLDTSVGAAALRTGPSKVQAELEAVHMSDKVRAYSDECAKYLADEDYHNTINFPDTASGRTARRFKEAIDKSPLKSDYDSLHARGIISKRTAYDIYESASGLNRNNSSSSRYMEQYHVEQYANTGEMENVAYDAWAKGREYNKVQRLWGSGKQDFWNDLIDYRASMFYDDTPTLNVHPAIKQYSEVLDDMFNKTGLNAKGLSGEIPLKGFEEFKPTKGWMSQPWDERAFLKHITNPCIEKSLIKCVANEYIRHYPDIKPEMVTKYAKALVNRKLSESSGLDTSLSSILMQDGREMFTKFLKANNFSDKEVKSFIAGITQSKAEKGVISHAKSRLNVDPRAKIEGTNLRLRDFMHTNIPETTSKYSRKMAGASALARKNYQLDTLPWIIQALKQEAVAAGKPYKDDFINNIFAPFQARPIGTGVSPVINRVLRLTGLSVLSQMGFPQLGELGGAIAASGTEAFWKTLPKHITDKMARKNSALTKELAGIGYRTGVDELVNNPKWIYDEVRGSGKSKIDFVDMADTLLAKGKVLQGNLSLFFGIKAMQQQVSVKSFLYRMHKELADTKMSPGFMRRLEDVWAKDWPSIEKYFKDGTVQIVDNEAVLNIEKWSRVDQGKFVRGLHSFVNQTVQRSMAGENTSWFSSDYGAILTYLKSFQLLAIQKQVVRNLRIGDASARNLLPYGLATAGLAFYAKQVINDSDKRNFEDIAKGAFALSNTTGWVPMLVDPLAGFMGLDDLKLSPYASARGYGEGLIATPAALGVINRLWNAPSAAVKGMTGNMSKGDVYALQATPIIGNMMGVAAMFNGIKRDIDKRKQVERRQKKTVQKQKQIAETSTPKVLTNEEALKKLGAE